MRLVLRLRQHLPSGFLPKPSILSVTGGNKNLNPNWMRRNYGQPARIEEEEEVEELDIDPRKLPADYDPVKFDPTCHRNPPSERVFRLLDEVSSLTLREAADLASVLMKKIGMTEAPVMGVLKGGAIAGLAQMGGNAACDGAQEEKKEEKTVFELKLESFEAASKIKVIKEVRSLTDLGLKEAKELVEKAPAVFRTGVSKEDAEQIIEKMKAVGVKVIME